MRRLGILSDTHGRHVAARVAVQALLDAGAEALVHCGDVGEEAVLDILAGQPTWFVWGNNDLDREHLEKYAADLGLICLGDFGRFDFAGRQFVVTHGDDPHKTLAVCTAGERGEIDPTTGRTDDYLLTGHTHVAHDRRFGNLRWINPGALYRARSKSVALLHLEEDRLDFIEIDL